MLDLEESMVWVKRVGFVVISSEVNAVKAVVADARLPRTRYGSVERDAYRAARWGESDVYQV